MSRIPQPSSSRSPQKPPSTPSRLGGSAARDAARNNASPTPTLRAQKSLKSLRVQTPSKSPIRRVQALPDELPEPRPTPISIREQIALKRAEAKKAMAKTGAINDDPGSGLEDAIPTKQQGEDMVDLGRWSVKETIERARSSGALNIASRSLPCIPSALFEIHLGITPEPLKSVPKEPPITTSSSDDTAASRRRGGGQHSPSWFEAQDLEILKAWSNEILEIQPEISMFGSLKTIDLHNNKLSKLPDSFADLTALTALDLSHNALTSLPSNLFALPALTNLNLSHNSLASLPFFSPFASPDSNPLARTSDPRGDWYGQSITRSTTPLPKLSILDVSHNSLLASAIEHQPGRLPASLTRLDLSSNPLGNCSSLIRALSRLSILRELRCEHADIGDDSFPVDLFADPGLCFPRLSIMDLSETQVNRPVIEATFLPGVIKKVIEFELTTEEPKQGVLRVLLGKRVVKEAWEVEVERKAKTRGQRALTAGSTSQGAAIVTRPEIPKESWEIEAEQGLLTEGAKRRARAMATEAPVRATSVSPSAVAVPALSASSAQARTSGPAKESWEIEAEQGLLTAGGRRRARAAAAAANLSLSASGPSRPSPRSPSPSPSPSPSSSASALSNPQYYSAATQSLKLPPSAQVSKALHSRSFSLAMPTKAIAQNASELALAIPTPSLPLVTIIAQPFSHTLKILTLANRRMDPSFCLPADREGPFLPLLEELSLEACNLGDNVPVSRVQETGTGEFSTQRANEPLLLLLSRLFPSLRTLNLSYNTLTSASLTKKTLSDLILVDGAAARKGLRHLRLRGNRLTDLDGFQGVAELFKGNRNVPEWRLEELDIRDNEVGKLPPELGLLPMDVFLVDGNVFRVPARRVWEREGTKGLLSWLRGRIE